MLRHAAAVVTHRGHGTVAGSLAAGVPLLVMPMGRDQGDNAARVLARGAGLRLKRSAGASKIAGALRRLLEKPSYAASAARLGAAIRANAGPAVAVEEVEATATSRFPGTVTAAH